MTKNLCFYCKKPGHVRDDCEEKKRNDARFGSLHPQPQNLQNQRQDYGSTLPRNPSPTGRNGSHQGQQPRVPNPGTGKLDTSHSRERRYRKEQPHPEWIRRCLAEEGDIRLRSVDSKSLFVQISLFFAHPNPIVVKGLIDSGCSGRAFINRKLVARFRLPTQKLEKPRALLLADDSGAAPFVAEEVASMHLRQCKLAVLSACATAAGNGEGLAGAFLRAGAHQVVAVRWVVDSSAARLYMETLYRALLAGESLERAMFRGRDMSFAVHSSSMGRRDGLLRVVRPNNSFTAIGVNVPV